MPRVACEGMLFLTACAPSLRLETALDLTAVKRLRRIARAVYLERGSRAGQPQERYEGDAVRNDDRIGR